MPLTQTERIEKYAASRGLESPKLQYDRGAGWYLTGIGDNADGRPLVYDILKELGISVGPDTNRCTPWKAIFPIESEPQAKVDIGTLLEEIAGAMAVLPDVVSSLDEYTLESLVPYARRLLLATVVLQQIEAKLYDSCTEGEDDEDGDDNVDNDGDAEDDELWEPADGGEYSESDKDRAIAELAANVSGDDYYDIADRYD